MVDATSEPPEPPMKPVEVAALLGLTTRQVYDRIESGEIPAIRTPGGQLRVHGDQLLAWLIGPLE